MELSFKEVGDHLPPILDLQVRADLRQKIRKAYYRILLMFLYYIQSSAKILRAVIYLWRMWLCFSLERIRTYVMFPFWWDYVLNHFLNITIQERWPCGYEVRSPKDCFRLGAFIFLGILKDSLQERGCLLLYMQANGSISRGGCDANTGAINLATLHRRVALEQVCRGYFGNWVDFLMLMRIESDFRNLRV